MSRIKINHLLGAVAPMENVLIKGWVRTRRDAKTFSFLEINDGSCLKNLQVIVDDTLSNYGQSKAAHNGIGGCRTRKPDTFERKRTVVGAYGHGCRSCQPGT